MGISRWTQDLTPYLEDAIITKAADNKSSLIVRHIIIDGPSMVYHVYSALTTSNHAISGSFVVPTYQQLNAGIDVFLSDLESCGAKIERIFFDGALPLSKRSTRLNRLEKSRMQLEHLRGLALIPTSLSLPQDSGRKELSRVLWQTRLSPSRSTSLTAPLIVPDVIEHLRSSGWSKTVFVVRGEAETFCASAAKESEATVLSNDSDFTLLSDMQNEGMVGMLHSLRASQALHDELLMLAVQCWRPRHIRERLRADNLLRVGFERSRDATASFATILQRSAKRQTDAEANEFTRFTQQYGSPGGPTPGATPISTFDLHSLDPRLAELVCQLTDTNENSMAFGNPDLWVTLPILLEDPSKDASWAYGRELRRLAYSLLLATYGHSKEGTIPSVTESIRKGQRITQDVVEVINPAGSKLDAAIRSCTADLATLLTSTNVAFPAYSPVARDYILWALITVLKQRAASCKSITPSITIREYLGLDKPHHHPSGAPKKGKSDKPDNEAEWRLLHLNANVQSVLYSLRMLHQTCVHLKDNLPAATYSKDFTELLQHLDPMPPIQNLFLDVDGVRAIMRQRPISPTDQIYRGIFPDDDLNSRGPTRSRTEVEGAVGQTMDEVVRKKRKKRRKHTSGGDKVGRKVQIEPQSKFSRNPFDILKDGD